ncbi:MAG: seg [Parcubacteria group bacterium]|nr:seg [Parcubacteria group bacterium]
MRLNLNPRQTLGIGFLALIALYALFQARYIILGPEVSLISPTDGFVSTTSLITISGTARNTTFTSLDDRPIFLDESGHFSETLLAPEGISTIIVKARDRFGRETEKTLRIVVNE